jgi:hypothetical protein
VARLGEFSPIEPLLSLGTFIENYRISQKYLATFSSLHKSCALILTHVQWIGPHFRRFFHTLIWDRCYDLKNIFAVKNCEKIGIFDSKQS